MIKKYTIHLDAIIVGAMVFLLAFAAIVYQRVQYTDLLEEHVALQWKVQDLEVNVPYLQGMYQQCLAAKDELSSECPENP